MSERLGIPHSEAVTDAKERIGFMGAIALMRQKLGAYTPGQRLDKSLEEIHATRPTLGDVAEGVEADLNHAAAVHAEHDTGVEAIDWEGDFPDKSFGYMDPNDPTSTYHGRND